MIAIRAVVYASVFISLLILYLPITIAQRDPNAATLGVFRYAAFILYVAGAAIGVWCIFGFIRYGRGTRCIWVVSRSCWGTLYGLDRCGRQSTSHA